MLRRGHRGRVHESTPAPTYLTENAPRSRTIANQALHEVVREISAADHQRDSIAAARFIRAARGDGDPNGALYQHMLATERVAHALLDRLLINVDKTIHEVLTPREGNCAGFNPAGFNPGLILAPPGLT